MNNVYVLTPDFKLEGIIDEYVSIIWRPSYSEVGDFEIYLGATDKAINLLQENRYVVRSSDISVTQYSGKNLVDINYTINGYKLPKPLPAGTYTVSFKTTGTNGGFRMSNSTDTSTNSVANSTYKNINGYVVITLTTTFITNYINLSSSGTVSDVMLTEGRGYVPYEPYVGGQPKSITTYEKVMVIKNIQLITDIENGDFLCITGRELKHLLHQRIVWSQTTLTGTAEESMRRLVNENAIAPTDNNRIIPNLVLGVSAGLTDAIEKQVTGEYLDKVITEICTTYNYGWDIFITNNKLVFVVYAGSDRSYEQTERPYVVFSDEFENLYNTDYQLFTEEYANTTLIGGEGEGLERVFATVNNQLSGLDRYETFTDARDISSNKGSEDEIDANTYLKLLVERGRENLATLSYTEGFSGEVLSDVAFKYGQDFFIGDTVTVINKYGIRKNVRVLSAIESEDETGVKLLPQFNI